MTDRAGVPAATALLLRHVPRFDGPYDDETPDRWGIESAGNLTFAFPPSTTLAVPLRLVPPAGGVDDRLPIGAAPAEPVPDPRRLIGPLAQAIAEVLTGFRPAHQLAQVATLDVLALLERNAGRLVPRGVRMPQRPRVSALRLCEPRAGVAEVAAVVDTGSRRRAMAMRLEAPDARWRCTVLRVG